jgi:hypothetical protein
MLRLRSAQATGDGRLKLQICSLGPTKKRFDNYVLLKNHN